MKFGHMEWKVYLVPQICFFLLKMISKMFMRRDELESLSFLFCQQ